MIILLHESKYMYLPYVLPCDRSQSNELTRPTHLILPSLLSPLREKMSLSKVLLRLFAEKVRNAKALLLTAVQIVR